MRVQDPKRSPVITFPETAPKLSLTAAEMTFTHHKLNTGALIRKWSPHVSLSYNVEIRN